MVASRTPSPAMVMGVAIASAPPDAARIAHSGGKLNPVERAHNQMAVPRMMTRRPAPMSSAAMRPGESARQACRTSVIVEDSVSIPVHVQE